MMLCAFSLHYFQAKPGLTWLVQQTDITFIATIYMIKYSDENNEEEKEDKSL